MEDIKEDYTTSRLLMSCVNPKAPYSSTGCHGTGLIYQFLTTPSLYVGLIVIIPVISNIFIINHQTQATFAGHQHNTCTVCIP